MNIALACVLTAGVLPIVAAVVSKWGFRGYDNRNPRAWLAGQTGFRARANAAQANSFESLPFFIGAVIIAHQLGARQTWLDLLAMLFVMLRMFYIMMYVSNVPTARSAVWAGAFMVNVAILFVGYR